MTGQLEKNLRAQISSEGAQCTRVRVTRRESRCRSTHFSRKHGEKSTPSHMTSHDPKGPRACNMSLDR
jgi:hypothetical protein